MMTPVIFLKIHTNKKASALPWIFREKKGFSLVEISIVLVIIGLILGASVTIWRSSIGSARLSTTKTNLDNIKNSVINFAIANGRLPCPDSTIPPANTGISNPVGAGVCVCPNPPCYVPFQTLQLQLPGGRDSFSNVFRYDISFDPAAGAGLTNTTLDTFCGVLFEYLNHATDAGVPRVPCVTNQNDGADNGQIGAAGQGYAVAAVIISETPIDNVFNAPLGLSGKNIAGTPREYEMASRANDNTYGNLASELTYGELFNKVCNIGNTMLKVYVSGARSAKIPSGGVCINGPTGVPAYLTLNSNVEDWSLANCELGPGTKTTYTFKQLSDTDWNGNKNGAVNANNSDY